MPKIAENARKLNGEPLDHGANFVWQKGICEILARLGNGHSSTLEQTR